MEDDEESRKHERRKQKKTKRKVNYVVPSPESDDEKDTAESPVQVPIESPDDKPSSGTKKKKSKSKSSKKKKRKKKKQSEENTKDEDQPSQSEVKKQVTQDSPLYISAFAEAIRSEKKNEFESSLPQGIGSNLYQYQQQVTSARIRNDSWSDRSRSGGSGGRRAFIESPNNFAGEAHRTSSSKFVPFRLTILKEHAEKPSVKQKVRNRVMTIPEGDESIRRNSQALRQERYSRIEPKAGQTSLFGNNSIGLSARTLQHDATEAQNTPKRKTNGRLWFDPDGNFHLRWRYVIYPCVVFNSINVPFRVAFGFDGSFGLFFVLSYITDLCFMFDIWLHFHTAFLEQGQLIHDLDRIAQRYYSRDFYLHFFASLPLDLLQIGFNRVVPECRINKILRLFQLFEFLNREENRPDANITTIRLVKLFCYAFSFLHISGCIWFLVSRLSGFGATSWVASEHTGLDFGRWHQYLYSLHWSLGIIASQRNNEVPETFFEHVLAGSLVSIGTLVFAYIVGSVGAVVDEGNGNLILHQAKLDYVTRFLRLHSISKSVQNEVFHYFDYNWSNQRGYNTTSILGLLPKGIETDVKLHLFRPIISKVRFLHGFCDAALQRLVDHMDHIMFGAGEIVCREGEEGESMYFLLQGKVDIIKEIEENEPRVVRTLHRGEFFGETSLFFTGARTATVQARIFCSVYVLDRFRLAEVLKLYPREAELMYLHMKQARVHDQTNEIRMFREVDRSQSQESYITVGTVPGEDKELMKLRNNRGFGKWNDFIVNLQILNRHLQILTIDPHGTEYAIFFAILFGVWMYNFLTIPYRVGFGVIQKSNVAIYIACDILTDFILWFAIFFHSRTSIYHDGECIKSVRVIAKHYLENWFLFDFLGTVPLDYFGYLWSARVAVILRLNRLGLGFHIVQDASLALQRRIGINFVRIVHMSFLFVGISHIIACAYHLLVEYNGYGTSSFTPPLQIYEDAMDGRRDLRYVRGLVVALKMFTFRGTIVQPESFSELFFAVFMTLFGLFFSAYIIGNVTSLLANFDALAVAFRRRTRTTHDFLRYHRAPLKLQQRVAAYHDHIWSASQGLDETLALCELPRKLHFDILREICEKSIRKIPQFQDASTHLLSALFSRMTFCNVPRHEFIVWKDQIGEEMYFILEGEVEVILSLGDPRAGTLGVGHFFGEAAILTDEPQKRNAFIRTTTPSRFLVLTKSAVLRVGQDFPEMLERFRRDVIQNPKSPTGSIGSIDPYMPDDIATAPELIRGMTRRFFRNE